MIFVFQKIQLKKNCYNQISYTYNFHITFIYHHIWCSDLLNLHLYEQEDGYEGENLGWNKTIHIIWMFKRKLLHCLNSMSRPSTSISYRFLKQLNALWDLNSSHAYISNVFVNKMLYSLVAERFNCWKRIVSKKGVLCHSKYKLL